MPLRHSLPAFLCALFVSALLLPACEEPREQPFLDDQKVSRIMADLYIAEAAATGLFGYSRDSLAKVYQEQVFEMHGVAKEDYEKNLYLLADDLDRFEAVIRGASDLLDPDTTRQRQ